MLSLLRTPKGRQQLIEAKWQKCVLDMYLYRQSPCVYTIKFTVEVRVEM